MRILVAHSRYRYPGGEETVFEQEIDLLREYGHEVIAYDRSNWESAEFPPLKKLMLPKRVIWAEDTRRDLLALLRETQPDIAHFHNTHFMISPSAYWACREAGVPVVQSLHNPRLMCPASTFYRDGHLCEDCIGKNPPWPAVLHGCYGGSRLRTAGIAAMITYHRWRRTWWTMVDTFVIFTAFYRDRFVTLAGLPPEKCAIKPHFVNPDPGPRAAGPGDYALYFGRLDVEKGVWTLLRAWEQLDIPLKIRGGGPLKDEVEAIARQSPHLELIGRLERAELFDLIKGARFVVWPSGGYYETFGMVVIEAYACGVPVIASNTGVAGETIIDQQTGLHFTPDDADDLAAKVRWAWDHPAEMEIMGRRARQEFEAKYTAARNITRAEEIYRATLARYQASGSA